MAPPAAKKQKRLIVLSSDEASEGDNGLSITEQVSDRENISVYKPLREHVIPKCSSSARRRVTEGRSRRDQRLNTSDKPVKPPLKPSPKKPKVTPRTVPKVSKSGSLYSFFNSATQTQKIITKLDDVKVGVQEDEDLIQDDFPDDGKGKPLCETKGKDHTTEKRKQSGDRSSSNECSKNKEHQPNGSQRFGNRFRKEEFTQPESASEKRDSRPWSERFAPSGLDELAVHKKKVLDVRRWLENTFQHTGYKRVLILKGPSGSGKTATLTALAKTLNLDIAEWRNPVGSEFASESFLSMAAQFEDFLGRSCKFGSLDFHSSGNIEDLVSSTNSIQGLKEEKNKVILIEEFPNTFTRTSTALHSFRSSVLHYLAASTPPPGKFFSSKHQCVESITPLIMIISETLLTTSTAAADSFTAHRLLGAEILNHPGVSLIEFNPVASTFLAKALNLVIQKEARQSGRRRTPGDVLLKRLGEVGDVRSAIGSLEFLCVRGDDGSDWGGRVAAKVKKGAKKASALTKMEQESIEMVTQREATLGIFHAVGKVVYNKRDENSTVDSKNEMNGQTPYHLSHHARPNTSQVSVAELIDETGTDTQIFVSALHENYALSCDGPSFTDSLNGCLDALSDSDLLSPLRGDRIHSGGTGRSFGGSLFQGAGTDNLLQEEMCFQVAVRGLLFALPYPVKRSAAIIVPGGQYSNRQDTFKMFYPTSLRLWKQTEEIEGLIDRWMDTSHASPTLKPVAGSVESWANKSSNLHTKGPSSLTLYDAPMALQIRANAARTEMVLEQLPYIAKIKQRDMDRSRLRELDKITQFHGVEQLKDQVSDEADEDEPVSSTTTLWTTDDPLELKDSSRARGAEPPVRAESRRDRGFDLEIPTETAIGKLVLSDDDIEDD